MELDIAKLEDVSCLSDFRCDVKDSLRMFRTLYPEQSVL